VDLLIFVVIAIVLISVVITLKVKTAPSIPDEMIAEALPFVKKEKFFTDGERSFYHMLQSAVGDQYVIFGQVRIADLLAIKKGTPASYRQSNLNKITSKHADFVLCTPNDLTIICAIELDDKSHKRADRVERDEFLNNAFRVAGLHLIHFEAKHVYSRNEIISQLQQFIEVKSPVIEEPVVEKESVIQKPARTPAYKQVCPKCNSDMLRKKVTKGEHLGELFWCCSKFPECKAVMPLAE